MVKMVLNEVLRDGMQVLKFHHSADDLPRLERYGFNYLLRSCPQVFDVTGEAHADGGRVTVVKFPVCNVVQVRMAAGWREFFMVHKVYGTGVRDCVRLGLEAWECAPSALRASPPNEERHLGEKAMMSADGFRMPRGVESGVEVSGCHLFEAEWMMPNVVAVG